MAECDSPECVQALARVQERKNEILSLCDRLSQLRASAASFDSLMKAMLAMAGALIALGTAAATIPVLGWIAALILYSMAAVFLALALYFGTRGALIKGQITTLENELADARNAFQNAVAEVMATCPRECWGDLDLPTCA